MSMFKIPLDPIPNQNCSVRLDGALFDLTIKIARELMTITIKRDGVTLVQGVRCLPDTPLIPHRYLEGGTGNFYFQTVAGSYPHYSRFGGTDTLFYATRDELEALRNG